MSDPTSNSLTIEADAVRVFDPIVQRYVDLRETVTGLAPESLNTLQKIAESIGNDSTFARL